jgi:hypothetical protein
MINKIKNDSVADAIKNILQQEEIDQKQRTKDMLSGRFNTQQKDDVGPGSDSKSTKVKYHPGPETQKEETVDETLKGNQHKIDKNNNNKIDAQDFKILRGQKKKKSLKEMREEFEEPIIDSLIKEVLSKDASAGDWIHDFVHSANPKCAGKSKAKRKEMALAAYYAKQRNEETEQVEEGVVDKLKAVGKKALEKLGHGSDEDMRKDLQKKMGVPQTGKKPTSEEVEQIDELSKSTLGSYVKGAARDVGASRKLAADFKNQADKSRKPAAKAASTRLSDKFYDIAQKRHKGIGKAVERLTKEESEEISENSPFDWKKPREPEVKGGAGVKAGRAYGGAAQKSKPEQEPEEKKK